MPEKTNTKKSLFSEFHSLKPHLYQYRRAYFTGLMFLILTDAAQILIPRIIGLAVDHISEGTATANHIGKMMLLVFVLAIFVATGRYGWRIFIIGSARRVESDLRNRMYGKLLTLTQTFYSTHKTGDLMARFTNDLQSIRMAFGMGLIAFVDGLFMTVVILSTLFVAYGSLGLLIIIPLPLVTAMALLLGKFIGPIFFKVQENFSRIGSYLQEALAGIRVVKSFVREKKTLEEFAEINAEYGKAHMLLVRFWGLIFPAMGFVAGLGVLLLLYFGGMRVILGELSPGDFIAILSYLGMLIWPAMGAGWVVNMIQRGAASMKRINAILDQKADIMDVPNAINTPPKGSLSFQSLSYGYKEDEKILDKLNFTVHEGTTMGIIGRTGSGKTTLIKLISRMLDPPENTIFIGGKDIRMFTRSALRHTLGIVPQDVFLFSETIRSNIVFAQPESTDTEIAASIHYAGLEADLPFFPKGLDTVVGEKGVTLSGGQKQRIAIARAIITNPEILILDDALSAVDADTEERILKGLFQIRRGKTTLMISHRISALSRCDRSVVLEDGKIAAIGTHEELLSTTGFYKEIARMQKLEQYEGDSA